jgi:hypothetical protein
MGLRMKESWKNRKETILWAIPFMMIFEGASLPFIGWRAEYAIGLCAGFLVSILCFLIMNVVTERVLSTGKGGLVIPGLLLRVFLYGGAFYFTAVKISLLSGLGSGLGFLTGILSVLFLRGVRPMIRHRRARKRGEEAGSETRQGMEGQAAEYEYAWDGAGACNRFVLIRSFSMESYRGGRTYVTHKRFRTKRKL